MGSEHVVVAVEERTHDFHGMIRLNATGAFLWDKMRSEISTEQLEQALVDEYSITSDIAKDAVAKFSKQLSDAGVIEP